MSFTREDEAMTREVYAAAARAIRTGCRGDERARNQFKVNALVSPSTRDSLPAGQTAAPLR